MTPKSALLLGIFILIVTIWGTCFLISALPFPYSFAAGASGFLFFLIGAALIHTAFEQEY
jgi:putative Mn2+ efflux pump MntP